MAHMIRIGEDGKADFAYRMSEGLPWHGLGTGMKEDANFHDWKIAAGFGHEIKESRVRYVLDRTGKEIRIWDDRIVLFRSDDYRPLAVVSDKFQVTQPREVLEFFRDLVEGGGFRLSTAGTLFGGKKYFASAKVSEDVEIGEGDRMRGYLLYADACDGSMRRTFKMVATRVVCNNTLTMALGEKGKNGGQVFVRHSTGVDYDDVKMQLGIAKDGFEEFCGVLEELTKKRMSYKEQIEWVKKFVEKEMMKEGSEVKVENTKPFIQIVSNLVNGDGQKLETAKNTAWGALNAVTDWVDHDGRSRGVDKRIENSMWGNGDALKTKALELLKAA